MVCITTDNGSNIVKAASQNNWTKLQCFGYRLHLTIGELCITIQHTVTISYIHLNLKNVSFIIKYRPMTENRIK